MTEATKQMLITTIALAIAPNQAVLVLLTAVALALAHHQR